eukprot:150881_1
MGVCNSTDSPSVNSQTREIDRFLLSAHKKCSRVRKLALLGTKSSGKSTIFKQLTNVYGCGIEEDQYPIFAHKIRQNIIHAMFTLLYKSQHLYDTDPIKFKHCLIDFTNDNIYEYIQHFTVARAQFSLTKETINLLVFSYVHKHENITETFVPSDIVSKIIQFSSVLFEQLHHEMRHLGKLIYDLWNLEAIQNTFFYHGNNHSFPDNMEYFFNKTYLIFEKDFCPSGEDILKSNVAIRKTEANYILQDDTFHIIINHMYRFQYFQKQFSIFQHINGIIFIAALNDFYKFIFDNEIKNAMHQSIELFDDVCNSKWFKRSEFILFLNKSDLFRESLLNDHSLTECFSIEYGWN